MEGIPFFLLRKGKIFMGIQVGDILIPWYGMFIVTGIAAGALAGYVLLRGTEMAYDDFVQAACFVGLGAMAGAKLLYLAVSWDAIDFSRITDPEYLGLLMGSGFVFYGGLLGGLAGLYLCGRILHIPVLALARETIPVIPLAHGFGRIGCALVGCCYGIPYDGPGAVVYTDSPAAPLNTPLFPVQAVEAAGEFVIAAVLTVYIVRCRKQGKTPRSLGLYLGLYAVLRFFLEFVRYDDRERGIFLGISTSQWISVAVLAAVALHFKRYKKTDCPL